MSNVLIVHAADTADLIPTLHAYLGGPHRLEFLRVDDLTFGRLRAELRRAADGNDVFIFLVSPMLIEAGGNVLSTRRFGDRFLRVPSISLNVKRRERRYELLLQRWFGARLDPIFKGRPLLEFDTGSLQSLLRELARFISDNFPEPPQVFRGSLDRSDFKARAAPRAVIGSAFNLLPSDPRSVDLYFVTNRAPKAGTLIHDFGSERSDSLRFGAARVRIPEDHKIGRLELPRARSWFRLRFSDEVLDERRHFSIKEICVLSRAAFLDALNDDDRAALVFVHGFNTSFTEGVLRLSQIVWDMQFRGKPILYSWPSRGGILNYFADKESALATRPLFNEFIRLLSEQPKVSTIHIVAHSMGNLVVLEALKHLAESQAVRLAEVVMAAPDVDADVFKDLTRAVRPCASGMTVYASSTDRAISTARAIAKAPRAGDVFENGPLCLPNVESIDVSAVGDEMLGLNHNVFASNRSVIDDIGRLISSGVRPPDLRSPQIRCVPEGVPPPRYWRYAI